MCVLLENFFFQTQQFLVLRAGDRCLHLLKVSRFDFARKWAKAIFLAQQAL